VKISVLVGSLCSELWVSGGCCIGSRASTTGFGEDICSTLPSGRFVFNKGIAPSRAYVNKVDIVKVNYVQLDVRASVRVSQNWRVCVSSSARQCTIVYTVVRVRIDMFIFTANDEVFFILL